MPSFAFRRALSASYRVEPLWLRAWSSARVLSPPRDAPRESPTPIVFVSVRAWDPASAVDLRDVAAEISRTGFTCLDCNLGNPPEPVKDSKELMQFFEHHLFDCIAQCEKVVFPPVIVARSAAALIAQTYISSHRASGMFLISPPASNSAVQQLPSLLEEFDYEMKFPIGITGSNPQDMEDMRRRRFQDDQGYVDTYLLKEHSRSEILKTLTTWLDERGF